MFLAAVSFIAYLPVVFECNVAFTTAIGRGAIPVAEEVVRMIASTVVSDSAGAFDGFTAGGGAAERAVDFSIVEFAVRAASVDIEGLVREGFLERNGLEPRVIVKLNGTYMTLMAVEESTMIFTLQLTI
jgi:hypothetical protein